MGANRVGTELYAKYKTLMGWVPNPPPVFISSMSGKLGHVEATLEKPEGGGGGEPGADEVIAECIGLLTS